jgi:hypothetical protein
MPLQEFFDARLKRKTDAVTGRVSKFAAENNRLWSTDLAKQMTDSMGAQLQPRCIMLQRCPNTRSPPPSPPPSSRRAP